MKLPQYFLALLAISLISGCSSTQPKDRLGYEVKKVGKHYVEYHAVGSIKIINNSRHPVGLSTNDDELSKNLSSDKRRTGKTFYNPVTRNYQNDLSITATYVPPNTTVFSYIKSGNANRLLRGLVSAINTLNTAECSDSSQTIFKCRYYNKLEEYDSKLETGKFYRVFKENSYQECSHDINDSQDITNIVITCRDK